MSKSYVFLLIKIYYRVIGIEVIRGSRIIHVLFVFGIIGMIMGSIGAIRENNIRRMIAYSSVAQIGYIFMGLGFGTEIGVVASVFHILSHAVSKALLFVSASGITNASGKNKDFASLTGAGFRNRIAGVGFTVGSLSMVGFPLFAGFISKFWFAQAAFGHEYKMLPALLALVISTILNAIYFMKTVIRIYTPAKQLETERNYETISIRQQVPKSFAIIGFILLNFLLGMCSDTFIKLIQNGLEMFG